MVLNQVFYFFIALQLTQSKWHFRASSKRRIPIWHRTTDHKQLCLRDNPSPHLALIRQESEVNEYLLFLKHFLFDTFIYFFLPGTQVGRGRRVAGSFMHADPVQGGPRDCGWHGKAAKGHRGRQNHASTSFAGWLGRFRDSDQMEILHIGFGAEKLPLSWTLWAGVFCSSSCGRTHQSGERTGFRRKEAFRVLCLFLLAGVGITSVHPDSSELQHPSANTRTRAEVVQPLTCSLCLSSNRKTYSQPPAEAGKVWDLGSCCNTLLTAANGLSLGFPESMQPFLPQVSFIWRSFTWLIRERKVDGAVG